MNFSDRLRELRTQENISQTTLAKIMNTTQQTVSKWESNILEPSYDILVKLCLYFKVSVDYMLGMTDY